MKEFLRRHKDIIVCFCLVLVTLFIIAGYLVYNRFSDIHTAYFFVRSYDTHGICLSLEPQDSVKPQKLTHPADNRVIASVVLANGDTLSFETINAKSTSGYAFYLHRAGEEGFYNRQCTFKLPFADTYCNKFERKLAFYGVFFASNNNITFTFIHLPYVYVFNERGQFVASIHTKDDVPMPSIIHYKGYYLYERGRTFNSNIASFVHNGNLYVMSSRVPKTVDQFLFDIYRLDNGKYSGSFSVDGIGNFTNHDVDALDFQNGNVLVVSGEHAWRIVIS